MAVEQLCKRLGSTVQEVRARASSALLFKLANSLLTPADFQAPEALMPVAEVLVRGDEAELEASVLRIAVTVCGDTGVAQAFARLLPCSQLAEIASSRSQSLRPLYDQLIDRVPTAPEPAQLSTEPAPVSSAAPASPLDPLRQSTPALRVPTLRSQAGNALLRASMPAAAPGGSGALAATPGLGQQQAMPSCASPSPLAVSTQSYTPNSAYTPDVPFMREQRAHSAFAARDGSELAATAPAKAGGGGGASTSVRSGAPAGMPDVMPSMLFAAQPLTPPSEGGSVRERFAPVMSGTPTASCAPTTAMSLTLSTPAHMATTASRSQHNADTLLPSQLAATAPPPSTRLRSRLRSQAAAGLLSAGYDNAHGGCSAVGSATEPPQHGNAGRSLAHERHGHSAASSAHHRTAHPPANAGGRGGLTHGNAQPSDNRLALEASMTDVAQSARAAGFATEVTLQPVSMSAQRIAQDTSHEGGQQVSTTATAVAQPCGASPLDARLRDVEQRKVCRAMEAPAAEPPQAPTKWLLPRVHVSALDDQHLFELNVKLQYADEDVIVVDALHELTGATLQDFPAQALLQRDALLETVLDIATSRNASEHARNLALAFMEGLAAALRRSLVDCVDAEMLPTYAEFEGPNAEGDLSPEEERLLRSIPQPADTSSLPEWRQPDSDADASLDVGAFCHRLAVRVIPCLHADQPSSCLVAAASLVEALMPLLAPDRASWGSAAAAVRIEQYLTALHRALEVQVTADSATVPGVRAPDAPDAVQLLNGAPVLGPTSVYLLKLAMRFLAWVPPDSCAAAVPPALAMQLGRLWCNPCIDVVIPHWRACVEPYLPALAPDCADAGRLAVEAESAIEHAQTLTAQAQQVLDGARPLAEWLPHVPTAVAAIAFGQHNDLLRLVLRVLASCASDERAAHGEGRLEQQRAGVSNSSEAAGVLLQLLQHPVSTVQQQTWAAVSKALAGQAGMQPSGSGMPAPSGLLRLLSDERIMRYLMMECVTCGGSEVREGVAEALQQMLACGDDSISQGVLRWQAWLECYASSPELGRACALADAHLQAASSAAAEDAEEGELEWGDVSTLLQRLFNKTKTVRQLAAKRLVALVAGGAGLLEDASIEDDPFRGLLDGAGPSQDSEAAAAPLDLSSLRMTDIHNLMACICNADLQPALRCSAVHQLQPLAGDAARLPTLAVPSFLSQCLAEVERAVGVVHGGAVTPEGEDVVAEPLSIFQMQLPVACLGLLGALASQSGGVLDWLMQHTGTRIQALLPLVFHPLTMVRRAAAIFLAPLIFLPACQLADASLPRPPPADSNSDAPPSLALGLFVQFTATHHLPMPHREEPLKALATSAEHTFTSELLGERNPEKMHFVRALVSLGALARAARAQADEDAWLRSGSYRCQHLRKLLDKPPSDIEVPYEVTRCLAATCQLNDADNRAVYDWGNATSAPTADKQVAAITALHSRCFGPEATACVLSADCGVSAMARVLCKPPTTRQGFPAWLAALQLLTYALPGTFLCASEVFELLAAMVPSVVAIVARWSPGAPAQSAQSASESDTRVALVLHSRQEQRRSQPVLVATLDAFALLLSRARLLCSAEQYTRILDLLSGVDAAGLLLNNVFANAAAQPVARHAAAAALQQAVELCAALQRTLAGDAPTRPPGTKPGKHTAPLDARADSASAGALVAASSRDDSEAAQVLRRMYPACKALLQAIVRTVGMPQRSADAGQMRGSALVGVAVATLRAICQAVPCAIWASAWSDAVGIFWLTRLLREPDTRLRCNAILLLAALVHPAAGAMRDAVLQAWPEGATKMLALALSPRQPPAVAAAALTFVAVAMASSSRSLTQRHEEENVPGTFGTGITDFGREALLSREFLWDAVATRQPPPGAAPRLLAAMHALLAQRAALLPHELLQYLEAHGGDTGTFLGAMDVRRQLQCSAPLARAATLRCEGDGAQRLGPQDVSFAALSDALRACSVDSQRPGDAAEQELGVAGSHPCAIAAGLLQSDVYCGKRLRASRSQQRSRGRLWLQPPEADFVAAPITAAGHASDALAAVLRCNLQDTQHAHAKMLSSLLCLTSVLLPAAVGSRAGYSAAASLAASQAASDAAISACRCLVQLVTRATLSVAMVREAVTEAAAYARCTVAEAFAHVLCSCPRAPRRLQTAAASALAALLAHGSRAAVVLSAEGGEEAYAHAALAGTGEDTRIGAALVDGLLCITADVDRQQEAGAGRAPLSAIPSNRPQSAARFDRSKPASGATEAAAAARLALQPLLAFSASAKSRVLGHDAFARWVCAAIAACETLDAKAPADEADPGTPPPAFNATDRAMGGEKLRRDEARETLAVSLCLLRSLAYSSDDGKAAIAQSGVLPALHGAWRAIVVSQPLALEALSALACVLSGSFEARHIVATEGRPPLLLRVTRVVFRSGVSQPLLQAATHALRQCAAALDGTLALLKTPFATDACKALRRATIRGEAAPCVPLLATLAAMASHGEGQRELLRLSGPPALLDVLVELAQTSKAPDTVAAAMLLLRNLCFRADNKSYFLADPRALPLFVAQLDSACANPESAASAASALWALLHRGERVKATLKGIPHAVNTIRRCQKLCDNLIEEDTTGEDGVAEGAEERVAVMRQITHSTRAVLRVLGVNA